MKEENNRTKRIYIRLKPEEFSSIQGKFKNTTCRKLSDYARKVLLDKPVTITYRNQSLDAFMEEMVRLRNDLNKLGNNYNQAFKKLNILNQISEFRTWINNWNQEKETLIDSINEIKHQLNKISNEWLR